MTSRFTKAASQLPFLEGLRFAEDGEELSTRQRAWRRRDITPAKGACAGGTRDHSTQKKRQRHVFWCSDGSPVKMKGKVDNLLAHWFLACVHSKRWGSLRRICAMAAATASSELSEDVSIVSASGAARSGAPARDESRRSRCCMSFLTWSRFVALPAATSSLCRRTARIAGSAVTKSLTGAPGYMTVPMSRPSSTAPRKPAGGDSQKATQLSNATRVQGARRAACLAVAIRRRRAGAIGRSRSSTSPVSSRSRSRSRITLAVVHSLYSTSLYST